MPASITAETSFTVGTDVVLQGPSPSAQIGVVFEDDGETGYFYALDFGRKANPIVDALQIYNVRSVTDRHLPSQAQIVWSEDGLKAALLINRHPHAVFDFAARRGYCRSGFPTPDPNWTKFDHAWDDSTQELFR